MTEFIHDDILDLILDGIADLCDRLFVCSTYPTTYTEASVTYMLAQHTITPGDGNGDLTVGNGDASGRKVAVTAQAAISVTNSGTALHVALCALGTTKILAVAECTSQALTAGNTVTVPTFDIEVADPA